MNQPGQVQFLKVCFRLFEVLGFLLNVDEVRVHFFMMFYFEGMNNYSIARARLSVGEGRAIRSRSCLVNIVLVRQRTKSINR
jgi:hypothetical protein